ncbi:carboxypeptidase regulatory-like domain-containing protein [archaeon]|nr:carboxypeptidase regulatory-like domain-containing protein [archaeon]
MIGKILAVLFALLLIIAAMVLFLQPVGVQESLEITVLDHASSRPLAGVTVRVYDSQSNLLGQQSTSVAGTVSFNLKPGEYSVNASVSGYSEKQKEVSLNAGKKAVLQLAIVRDAVSVCVEKWDCGVWTPCTDGFQTRECTDMNDCGTDQDLPDVKKMCVVSVECEVDADCVRGGNPCISDSCINGKCLHSSVTVCFSGDGCCPSGCSEDQDNDCKLIGQDCVKDSDCISTACLVSSCLKGACIYAPLTDCISGDGCCPSTCEVAVDSDCVSSSCVSAADCFDGDPCTIDNCVNGVCDRSSITNCSMIMDECCPSGCDESTDADCGSCAKNSDCEDGDPCTSDSCTGYPLACQNRPVIQCGSSDGCCPLGCSNDEESSMYDSDCTEKGCTHYTDCDDGNACTEDICNFDSFTCDNVQITSCIDSDGCCAPGCDETNDNDCSGSSWYCESNEDCVSEDPCTESIYCDLTRNECVVVDKACGPSDGCCPGSCYEESGEPCEHYGGDPDCEIIEPCP